MVWLKNEFWSDIHRFKVRSSYIRSMFLMVDDHNSNEPKKRRKVDPSVDLTLVSGECIKEECFGYNDGRRKDNERKTSHLSEIIGMHKLNKQTLLLCLEIHFHKKVVIELT